jgi:D-alanine-D-alanine ligase-like ATP-grasp enzyme
VKSVEEEASFGIAQASVVNDAKQLAERVAFVHESSGTDALVEQYVSGRELTISVLGNQRLTTFPVWELYFDELPEGTLPIATAKVKWDVAYQKKLGIRTGRADPMSDETARRVAHLARRVYRVLGLSGYARLDLRMTDEGRIYVIEANATPDITYDEDFAESATSRTGSGSEPTPVTQRRWRRCGTLARPEAPLAALRRCGYLGAGVHRCEAGVRLQSNDNRGDRWWTSNGSGIGYSYF